MPAELQRLTKPLPWRLWGPYLAERAWGTVREDYSAGGDAWRYFRTTTRAAALSLERGWAARYLRRGQRLCFALALWNGEDAFLKERAFGLSGRGNHGEDAKDYWFYLDNVPTHAYMRALYKYPQRAFPYQRIIDKNRERGKNDPEFELLDSDAFDGDRYFDVKVEYAKASPTDILIRITVANRGPDAAPIEIVPTLWFRNTWAWGIHSYRPSVSALPTHDDSVQILAEHETLGRYHLT
jgi:hypothetical protein